MRTCGLGPRLAFLPGVTDQVHIAPGGRTAVSVNHQTEREGEQPRLLLWDLDTSARRAGLLLPEVSNPFLVEYSADGRYVFADYSTWPGGSCGLRWWDAASGRQVGEVANPGDTAFIGGRVLMTHPWRVRENAACEGSVLVFWDIATGEPLGEWDLGAPRGDGMINGLVASEGGCYLAAEYDPDYGRGSLVRRYLDWLSVSSNTERQQILVWDVAKRSELARLPGNSAAFSSDGRWLATLDGSGVVRAWELPVQRPWARILGYAAACALGCWVMAVLLGRLRSRWGTTQRTDAVPGDRAGARTT